MLEFFRKYQSYIFLVVTVVIVISFSFFGTYNTIVSDPVRNQVVFTAVDGENIRRSDLDEMVMFISTDDQDKQFFGGAWGPNFLNNGIIRKDLIESGIGEILAIQYLEDLKPDLESRLQKEKAYVLYTHPQAKFISQESVWSNYAPKINENLKALKNSQFGASASAFNTRVQLFLSEMAFPGNYLRYVMNSQEKQLKSVAHDANLDRVDLSLFGYHTVEDWFGPRFIRLSAQFIINAAKIAEQKGYTVTKEEALADLMRNSQISYNQNINNPNLGVANSTEYYNEQLRRLGMDQNQAVKVWSQAMLFRRLFQDVGNAVFVDPLTYKNFSQYANESVEGELYSLPKEMQFADYRTMQKFEIYLSLVSKQSADESKNLSLPEKFLTVAEVSKRNQELVQKRYLIKFTEANKKNLTSKVSLKETWNFEVDNWDLLKNKFPEIAVKKAETREERFKTLESLDDVTRSRVDQFARAEIVEEHPEWLTDALDKSRERTTTVGLSNKGNSSIFEGLINGEDLIKELDKLPLGASSLKFTADNQHYYLITVLDRAENAEILTFAEANRSGILDQLLEDKLQAHFQKEKSEKNWKSYDEEKAAIADDYFANVLTAIAEKSGNKDKLNGNILSSLRFFGYMSHAKSLAEKDPKALDKLVAVKATESKDKQVDNKLPLRESLESQWKLQKTHTSISRQTDAKNDELFSLPANSWTKLVTAPNGEITFFHVESKGNVEDVAAISEQMKSLQKLISNDAQIHYMNKVVGEIKKDNAISLSYLNQPIETMNPVVPENGLN